MHTIPELLAYSETGRAPRCFSALSTDCRNEARRQDRHDDTPNTASCCCCP
jgi:hypothetical protein